MADTACRDLSAAEIETYRREGVVLVRDCVDPAWIERMTRAIDRQLRSPGEWVQDTNPGGSSGRFMHDRYLWPSEDEFREFAFTSGVGELAAQAMGSDTARIYFDHVFVKEPNTTEEFFWHQDLPYWPFAGSQICSVWLSLTDVDIESSGLEFVRGSDKWGKWYKPVIPGNADPELAQWVGESDQEDIPDFNQLRDDYEYLSFATNAGDALIFNAAIAHTSHGNLSSTRRRVALSTRWLGDDARWDPRPGTDPIVTQDDVTVEPGALVHDDRAFPVVWPATHRTV